MSSFSPSARRSGTRTRFPASLSRENRGPVSYSREWLAVRTSTALPCPMSAASNSNCPGAARAGSQSNTGNISGMPSTRQRQGNRMATKPPPSTPATAHHNGAAATLREASGQWASHCKNAASSPTDPAATSQMGAYSTPSMATGVTSKVTQGMASALASKPTNETWLNSSSDKSVSAIVTTHCSRAARHRPAKGLTSHGRQNQCSASFCESNLPLAPVSRTSSAPESVANNTPTATNDNQKPPCISAQGSTATTTAMASSQICCQGHCLPLCRSSTTVASIQD